MNVFIGRNYQELGCGAYKKTWIVVLANTSREALEMLLDEWPDTVASDWDIDELNQAGAHYITSEFGYERYVDE